MIIRDWFIVFFPQKIKDIIASVTIPVMAKCRIGHFAEAQILESLGVDMVDESEGELNIVFYTSTKSLRGYIFTAVCLCVCLCVCVCVRLFSCEQNSSQTDEPIWTRFSLNGSFPHWLGPY